MAKASKSSSLLPMASSDPSLRTEDKLFKGSAMTKSGVYASVFYMTCAVLLVLFNKAALSSYSFPCANVITLCQMICSCCFLFVLRRLKLIAFSTNESKDDNSKTFVPIRTLISTSPLSLTYLLFMYGGCSGCKCTYVYDLKENDYCIYDDNRIHTHEAEVYSFCSRKRRNNYVGCFHCWSPDLSFDSYGYLFVFVSNITTAIYLTTIAHMGKSKGLNSFGLMWCNGVLCAPILLIWTLQRGDLETTLNFPYLLSPGFLAVLLLSCILAFLLNYSIFLNTTLNSALTQNICGNLKDFITISLGWAIFGGLPFDLLNVVGQLFGFIGSAMYAYYKLVGK